MLLGVSLAALTGAQMVGAYALWPSKPAPMPPATGMQSERINELEQGNARLEHELAELRKDHARLDQNEAAAIKAKEESVLEQTLLEAKVADLDAKCADLKNEAVRHRKAATSAQVALAAIKKRGEGG